MPVSPPFAAPRPHSPAAGGADEYREMLIELRHLALRCLGADAAGLLALAGRANEIILTLDCPPEVVLGILHGTGAAPRLLTGRPQTEPGEKVWSVDEVMALLETRPEFLVRAMRNFPGKRSAIDLSKLTEAMNRGRFVV